MILLKKCWVGIKQQSLTHSLAITTTVENPAHDEVYLITHYVIMFVSDLRQVCSFLQVLQFPPLIKPDRHGIAEALFKVVLNTISLTLINRSSVPPQWCKTFNTCSGFTLNLTSFWSMYLDVKFPRCISTISFNLSHTRPELMGFLRGSILFLFPHFLVYDV